LGYHMLGKRRNRCWGNTFHSVIYCAESLNVNVWFFPGNHFILFIYKGHNSTLLFDGLLCSFKLKNSYNVFLLLISFYNFIILYSLQNFHLGE
jgi:hypothetical protein